MSGDARCPAQGRNESLGQVVDLDRGKPETREPGRLACLPHEARKVVPALTVAIAPQVDPREDDLAVALVGALAHLGEHRLRPA